LLLLVVSKFASICKSLFCFFGCSLSLTLNLSVLYSSRLLLLLLTSLPFIFPNSAQSIRRNF
jgi:hypothetical protein